MVESNRRSASVNMRAFAVLVTIGLIALACGYTVPGKRVKTADKDFLHKQKQLLELVQHVHQNEVLPKFYEEAKNFHFDQYYDQYNHVEYVKEFYEMYKRGLLPMNEIFSIFNEDHLHEVRALFRVFYYAKTWDVFYKTAQWARFYVNEGMFIYALTTTIVHRPDFAGLELPAIYELYPYYFFNAETIQTAQNYKMQGFYGLKKVEDVYTVIIPSNYTSVFAYDDYEQKLAYYREDVGLNAAYYYRMAIDYPFWLGGQDFNLYKDRRGEFYLYQIQQILARYYLERLSNDLGTIPELDFYEPIKTGYSPALRYYNGIPFASRNDYYVCYDYEENYYPVRKIWDYVQRVRDVIDKGFVTLPDGKHVDLRQAEAIDVLGNLIQANPDSYNFRYFGNIEALIRQVLGGTYGVHGKYQKIVPGVIDHYETSPRDPVFYQMYKYIIRLYWQFKDHLPAYKYNEIAYQGVKIESVDVDKLVTYFDKYDSDITNAVNVQVFDDKYKKTEFQEYGRISQYNGEDFVIKARQWRLNHIPFTVKLNVFAEKAGPSVVRVFIGPKYDENDHIYEYTENRENWYMLDYFKYDLVQGKNAISRDSQEMFKYIKDRTTYFDLYKWVMTAEKGQNTFPLDMTEAHSGVPSRFMLPKGKKGGMQFRMFFIVSPYYAPTVEQYTGYDPYITAGIGSGARFVDSLPFGYPFDRKIDETVWYTPNMYYYDVNIFHKTEAEVNAVH